MFQTEIVEKMKTHMLCSENRAVYEILEKYGRARHATDDNIIWSMRVACWITKAAGTLRICNTYYFFTATRVTRRASLLRFMYAVSLVLCNFCRKAYFFL
jgi:hypothetical protein